jgi:hypothetical protein
VQEWLQIFEMKVVEGHTWRCRWELDEGLGSMGWLAWLSICMWCPARFGTTSGGRFYDRLVCGCFVRDTFTPGMLARLWLRILSG